jgi:hypothetical protein
VIKWQLTKEGECETFEEVPKTAEIIEIDGVACIGMCEVCGMPILEGCSYFSDDEGTIVHSSCLEEKSEEEEEEMIDNAFNKTEAKKYFKEV